MGLTIILPLQALPMIAAMAMLFALVLPEPALLGPWYRRAAGALGLALARIVVAVLCGVGLWVSTTVGGAFFQAAVVSKVRSETPPAPPAKPERPA